MRQTKSDVSNEKDNEPQGSKFDLSTHKSFAITYVLPSVFY